MKNYFVIFLILFVHYKISACQCPVIQWSKNTADQNDVIFRGSIKNIFLHQNNYTVAEIEVLNLFKGNAIKTYKVLFPENDDCAIPLNTGEEWIIYGKNKQINSCEIDWCGLSRKKFINDNEDFFIATHIITYDEELQKLQMNFPEIKINTRLSDLNAHKNILPDKTELYLYLALSLAGFVIILYLVKNYFK